MDNIECPDSLIQFSPQQILQLFNTQTNKPRTTKNLKFKDPKSVFGIVAKQLNKTNSSSLEERKFIYQIWKTDQNLEQLKPAKENKSVRQKIVRKIKQVRKTLTGRLFSNNDQSYKKKRKKSKDDPINKKIRQEIRNEFISAGIGLLEQKNKQTRSHIQDLQLSLSNLSMQNENEHNKGHAPGSYLTQNEHYENDDICNSTLENVIADFTHKINDFPTHKCQICHRMVYKGSNSTKPYTVTTEVLKLMHLLDCFDFTANETLATCRRCYDTLNKGKIPPMSYFNKMDITHYPQELQNINDVEARLISQVKPFMKIYHLCKGRGQMALKGSCVHFPQSVEEIIEKLPLTPSTSDIILINETRETCLTKHEFQVRGQLLYAALIWLKANNASYSNIQIQQIPEESLQIKEITSTTISTDISHEVENGLQETAFMNIGDNRQILRASFHQGSTHIFTAGGTQCTAMCAAAIAYANLRPVSTWTTSILDSILIKGNSYYRTIAQGGNVLLEPEQVCGYVPTYDGRTVILTPGETAFAGFFNKYKRGASITRLSDSLHDFVNSEFSFGILTAANSSVALFKTQHDLYLFDSHSRAQKGRVSAKGTACVIKCSMDDAPSYYQELIHANLQPKHPCPNTTDILFLRDFQYQIIPVVCSNPEEEIQEEIITSSSDHISSDINTGKTQFSEQLSVQHTFANPSQQGNLVMLDCVIRNDDFIEPETADFINQCKQKNTEEVHLVRQEGRPLYPEKESRLEELAFVKCFPYGINGFNEERKNKITMLDYFQQRVMGSNQYFHTNEYLFYALSRLDNHVVRQKIGICGKMTTNDGAGDVEPNLFLPGLESVHLYMSAIRGSASYWRKYTGDVMAMIQQLGVPTLFLTISYDDLNSKDSLTALWKSKYGPHAELEDNPNDIPYDIKKDLLNENPVASARHFSNKMWKILGLLKKRSEFLFGRTLKDYTYRVEFQGRGSPHVHMLLWLNDPPDWNTSSGIDFINDNISCSLDVPYNELVTRYQNHRHSSTCFKKNKVCRFAFPRKPSLTTRILDDEEIAKSSGRFIELKRNPEEIYINNYHPKLLQILRCNIDIQAVTGARSIAYYIGKYISKAEPTHLREEIKNIIQDFKNDNQSSYYRKALRIATAIIKEREVSAPEAAFRLCHLPLRMSSRSTVFVPTYQPQQRLRMVQKESINSSEPKLGLNIIDRYENRPDCLAPLCLLEFAAHYAPKRNTSRESDEDLIENASEDENENDEEVAIRNNKFLKLKNGKGQIFKRKFPAVVKHPFFNPIEQKDNFLYSTILLYLPFRNESTLQEYNSIREAFNALRHQFRTNADDPIINMDLTEQINAAMLQIMEFEAQEEGDALDNDQEVFSFFEEVPDELNENEVFIPLEGNIEPNANDILDRMNRLTPGQKFIFKKVRSALNNPSSPRLLEFVQGCAGTGKSYLIDSLTLLIHTRCIGKEKSLIKAAPTGVAARNIGGVTLHKAFSLGIETYSVANYIKLGGKALHQRRMLYRDVDFIIIDEVSMISYETLKMLHLRLCEIFNNNEPFGNKHVILLGDLLQIKPCRGHWCFSIPQHFNYELNLWRLFHFNELTEVKRQKERDQFYDILQKLRIGILLPSDVVTLRQRLLEPAYPNFEEMKTESEKCLHLYPTVKLVDNYNNKKIKKLVENGAKMYNFKAKDSFADWTKYGRAVPTTAIPKDPRKCAGAPHDIQLCVGSRVMLRWNVDVSGGLCNGSIGEVRGFIWTALRREQREIGDLPESVLIKFDDNLDRRHYSELPNYRDCTHVAPKTYEFIGNRSNRISRFQLPLSPCFACTIHKAQGISVDNLTVYLGSSLFQAGMAYVALSRIRSFNGLFITNIDENKLLKTTTNNGPCNDAPLRELERLRLIQFLEIDEQDLDNSMLENLITWELEYVSCKKCKNWICVCTCTKGRKNK